MPPNGPTFSTFFRNFAIMGKTSIINAFQKSFDAGADFCGSQLLKFDGHYQQKSKVGFYKMVADSLIKTGNQVIFLIFPHKTHWKLHKLFWSVEGASSVHWTFNV